MARRNGNVWQWVLSNLKRFQFPHSIALAQFVITHAY